MPSYPDQVRLVGWCLIAWGLVLAGLGLLFFAADLWWPIAAFSVAGLNVVLGVWALAARRWVVPLFASLYALALACLVLGAVTFLDVYVATGVLALCMLTVGACLLHALHRIAPPWVASAPKPQELPKPRGTAPREPGPLPTPWTRKTS